MSLSPYYNEDGITIYHGDCRRILPELGLSDLVLTDPPYGMKKTAWDILIPPDEWLPLARKIGPVALFTGVRGLFDYPKPDWVLAWIREASAQRNGRFGGFNNWEPILWYGTGRISNDTFSVPNIPDGDSSWHPCPKPLKLMRLMIGRLKAKTLVDPFMGSGTTLIAAKDLGCNAIGIEADEHYCEMASRRLSQAVFNFSGAE